MHKCFLHASLLISRLFTALTTNSSLCFPYAHVCEVVRWVTGNRPGAPTSNFKWLCLPQQPSNVSSSTAGGKVWERLSSNIWILTLFISWVHVCKRHVGEASLFIILLSSSNSFIISALSSEIVPESWEVETLSCWLAFTVLKSGTQATKGEKASVLDQQWPARGDSPTGDTVAGLFVVVTNYSLAWI